jgi:RNA polymerase sigma factor (TIGR02999 family)
MEPTATVSLLVTAWRSGDAVDLERLMPLVYAELHALAQRRMQQERPDHTLQPTALVHEAFLRLSAGEVDINNRVHFFALAASTMRRVLVDHAKSKRRDKRGGGAALLPLDEALNVADAPGDDIVALDEAMAELAEHDPRKARVIELHYFAGLNYDEIAAALDIGVATVNRDLRFAKAWLHQRLQQ